jgi:hypothetical protein
METDTTQTADADGMKRFTRLAVAIHVTLFIILVSVLCFVVPYFVDFYKDW